MPARTDGKGPLAVGVLATLVTVKLVVHFATNALSPYSFHRDEFLYMAMGENLRLWHMDFAPAIAMLSEISRFLLGDSVFAVRLFPALLSTALLCLAVVIAWEFGGGKFAQGIAGLAVLANLLFLRAGTLFQPVVLDQLWWTLGLYALVRLAKSDNPRWWLLFGGACGFGLLSKFSILVFGLAVFLAMLTTPLRKSLLTRWPWLAFLVVIVLGGPSLVGQLTLGFPVLDQLGVLRHAQLARVTTLDFLAEQFLMGPGTVLAAIGLVALTFSRGWRDFRMVGWSCLWAFVLLIVLHGKPYYAGPLYPALYAAGAVVLERFRPRVWGAVVRYGSAAAIVLYALITLPMGLPVLGPTSMERYLGWLGSETAVTTNVGAVERLPQDYADMLGWEEQVAAIARVYHRLDPSEREQAVLLGSNYGEAGAIDFFGPRYDLPGAVAIVGSYWFFGPGELPGDVVLAIGFERDNLTSFFSSVEPAGFVTNYWAVEEQRDLTIFVCRGPSQTLQQAWPGFEGQQ